LSETHPDPLAILILGPTGGGKTALSLALGERFDGEIVSCDSVAVYRGMDLGSAKPSAEEQRRLPHHLIDIANPDEVFSAGEYARQARAAMSEIGLFPGPPRQQEMRNRLIRSLQDRSAHWLHRMLERLDPPSAARIHANDTPKLIRALEILFTTGQPLSATLEARPDLARDPLTGFRLLRIGLNPPRQALYDRLNRRAAQMFESGLVEETRTLLTQYGRIKTLHALGYHQAIAVLDGTMLLAEAIAAASQGHRNYAKRQLTWFRREPEVRWIEDFGDASETIAKAIDLVQNADPQPKYNLS